MKIVIRIVMDNLCPITYAKARVKERGYDTCRLIFRDLQLQGRERKTFTAYNELWLILEADDGIKVASDYGIYNYRDTNLMEQIHEHADRITLVNSVNIEQRIKFLQVLMVAMPQINMNNEK